MAEMSEKLEGEFRAMKAIVKSLSEHLPNVTPAGRRWLAEKIAEMMSDGMRREEEKKQ